MFGDYNNSDTIVIFYSLSLALAKALLSAIWFYALGAKLVETSLSRPQITYYSVRFILAPTVFLVSIPLVYIDPVVSKISWVFVIFGTMLVNRIFNFKRISTIEKQSI